MKSIFVAFALVATPAMAASLAPSDAGKHIGETATVEGAASVYTARSGVTFIDLGGSGRDSPFAGVIFKDKATEFPGVGRYNGRAVEISGTIKDYKGKPEIILNTPTQLRAK
jgi:hypothetical protein